MLPKLKILSIQSNRITRLDGLRNVENLLELYISHNGVESLAGIHACPRLQILDVGNNRIKKLEGVGVLKNLVELWANGNMIDCFKDIEAELGPLEMLETVYFEGNPLEKDNRVTYRNKVRLCLPRIKQIDATFV